MHAQARQAQLDLQVGINQQTQDTQLFPQMLPANVYQFSQQAPMLGVQQPHYENHVQHSQHTAPQQLMLEYEDSGSYFPGTTQPDNGTQLDMFQVNQGTQHGLHQVSDQGQAHQLYTPQNYNFSGPVQYTNPEQLQMRAPDHELEQANTISRPGKTPAALDKLMYHRSLSAHSMKDLVRSQDGISGVARPPPSQFHPAPVQASMMAPVNNQTMGVFPTATAIHDGNNSPSQTAVVGSPAYTAQQATPPATTNAASSKARGKRNYDAEYAAIKAFYEKSQAQKQASGNTIANNTGEFAATPTLAASGHGQGENSLGDSGLVTQPRQITGGSAANEEAPGVTGGEGRTGSIIPDAPSFPNMQETGGVITPSISATPHLPTAAQAPVPSSMEDSNPQVDETTGFQDWFNAMRARHIAATGHEMVTWEGITDGMKQSFIELYEDEKLAGLV